MGLRFRMASPGLGIGYVCHTLISGLPGLGKQALSRMAAVCAAPIERAADLKDKVDESTLPDPTSLAPEVEPPAP